MDEINDFWSVKSIESDTTILKVFGALLKLKNFLDRHSRIRQGFKNEFKYIFRLFWSQTKFWRALFAIEFFKKVIHRSKV